MTRQNMHALLNSKCNNERGFSLLEVMIALLVLSIGLLGIAGLQTYSLQFNNQSYERTQATLLISEMAEKIMANPIAARAGSYASGVAATASTYGASVGCPTNCASTADLATYDLFLWKSALENPKIMSQGTGSITAIADPLDADALVYDITVNWVENNLPMNQKIRVRTL